MMVVVNTNTTMLILLYIQIDGDVQLPKLAGWRVRDRVGLQLTAANSHIVRANFFNAPAHDIPKEIFQYNVSIFK